MTESRPASAPPLQLSCLPTPTPLRPSLPVAATEPSSPQPFHWRQIESADYQLYLANLRALGCPEHLVRDVISADLDELYTSRKGAVQRELFPPWAGADRRQAAHQAYTRQIGALEQEQRAVTEQLLGYPWSRQAYQMFQQAPLVAILLSHLTPDRLVQSLSLFERYHRRADLVRDRTQHILLAEDRAELVSLADELKSRLAELLNPTDLEELVLRVHWAEDLASDRHFELANLTGDELRQVVHLHSQTTDPLVEDLIGARQISDVEQAERERIFDVAVLELLGPEISGGLKRAADQRFRDSVDFAQQRQLPRQTAVTAYEIRIAAEDEVKRLREGSRLDASDLQTELETVQTATITALARLLGPAHLGDYLSHPGQWLEGIGSLPAARGEAHP